MWAQFGQEDNKEERNENEDDDFDDFQEGWANNNAWGEQEQAENKESNDNADWTQKMETELEQENKSSQKLEYEKQNS